MYFGELKPEFLAQRIESLTEQYTHHQLIEEYVKLQHQLMYEASLGEWLDSLANAFRDDNQDAWEEERIAKHRFREIKKEIQTKYA
jgi:hypothetical protein